jgi:hypothetical protein
LHPWCSRTLNGAPVWRTQPPQSSFGRRAKREGLVTAKVGSNSAEALRQGGLPGASSIWTRGEVSQFTWPNCGRLRQYSCRAVGPICSKLKVPIIVPIGQAHVRLEPKSSFSHQPTQGLRGGGPGITPVKVGANSFFLGVIVRKPVSAGPPSPCLSPKSYFCC